MMTDQGAVNDYQIEKYKFQTIAGVLGTPRVPAG